MSKKSTLKYYLFNPGVLLSSVLFVSAAGYAIDKALPEILKNNKEKKTIELAGEISEIAFRDLHASYDEYIKAIAEEIRKTEMDVTITDTFASYLILQSNGCISIGDDFEYADPKFEITDELGVSIVLGEGVCRNQANNLCRVLKELGYTCGVSIGECHTGDATYNANHEVVFVKDSGVVYLLDPTNKTIFLRNMFGQYVSISDENLYFIPQMTDDEKFGYDKDNLPLYMNMDDDYGEIHTYQYRFSNSLEKANSNLEYYFAYEDKNLVIHENNIEDLVDEYLSVEEEYQKKLQYKE